MIASLRIRPGIKAWPAGGEGDVQEECSAWEPTAALRSLLALPAFRKGLLEETEAKVSSFPPHNITSRR